MSKVCVVCNKHVVAGNKVSHSHRASRRTWQPNLQRVRIVVDGRPVRANVCTRCLRSGKVERYVKM